MSLTKTPILALSILFLIASCTPFIPTTINSTETTTDLQPTKTLLSPTETPILPTATRLLATEIAPIATDTLLTDSMVISLPSGNPPQIDGTLSPGEWEGAAIEKFADGSELLLLQNDGYLYLAIRAKTEEMVVGNIFIHRGEEISILHASAALGTAIYQQDASTWQQIKAFDWCCRGTSNSASDKAERKAFFDQEGWVSVNSRLGTPNELEYQIEIGSEPIRLAANYLTVSSDPSAEKTSWPPYLEDDVVRPTPGGLPQEFNFSPEQWVRLDT